MMIIAFKLAMPSKGSWNGKWSGENNLYVIVRNIKAKENAEKIIKLRYFSHRWNDGWTAGITAYRVDSKEASKLRRRSAGFCGYDWMVESIINKGIIEINY